jgi:acyl carrier protein
MAMSEEQLVHSVITWLRHKRRSGAYILGDISPDTDLIATGLLDSLGLIDLVLFLEQVSGRKIDLNEVDPGEFSVVKGLARITLRSPQT